MSYMAEPQVRRYLKSRVLMIRFVSIISALRVSPHIDISHPKMEQILTLAGSK